VKNRDNDSPEFYCGWNCLCAGGGGRKSGEAPEVASATERKLSRRLKLTNQAMCTAGNDVVPTPLRCHCCSSAVLEGWNARSSLAAHKQECLNRTFIDIRHPVTVYLRNLKVPLMGSRRTFLHHNLLTFVAEPGPSPNSGPSARVLFNLAPGLELEAKHELNLPWQAGASIWGRGIVIVVI
jgi:hypothetical protein